MKPTTVAPVLTLKPMEPQCLAKGADALRRLARIQWLEIAAIEKEGDVTYYVTHIFTHNDLSRLPTATGRTTAAIATPERRLIKPSGHVGPAYRTRRRFSEFVELHTALLDAVQSSHPHYCHLCNAMQSLLLFSATRLAMAARTVLVSPRLRASVLNKLVRESLRVLLSSSAMRQRTSHHQVCQAAREIPQTLVAFLFGTGDQHP